MCAGENSFVRVNVARAQRLDGTGARASKSSHGKSSSWSHTFRCPLAAPAAVHGPRARLQPFFQASLMECQGMQHVPEADAIRDTIVPISARSVSSMTAIRGNLLAARHRRANSNFPRPFDLFAEGVNWAGEIFSRRVIHYRRRVSRERAREFYVGVKLAETHACVHAAPRMFPRLAFPRI